jgi:putative addiction module CopG family antidote
VVRPVANPDGSQGVIRVHETPEFGYYQLVNVTLPRELELFVKAKVKSGEYRDMNEMIRIGLRLLTERDDQLRRDIQAAFAEGGRGKYIHLDAAGHKKFFENIKARGRRRLAGAKERKAC